MTSPNKPKALYAKEDHSHPLEAHDHEPLVEHTHDHWHQSLEENIRVLYTAIANGDSKVVQAVRALIKVFEVGVINSEQTKAIHNVRVAIGDAYGTGCPHELRAFEKGDRLICQSCRLDVTRQFAT